MAISISKKEVKSGIFKTVYTVIAEGINEFTGQRVQRKKRGIESRPKAELIYKQLWHQCRYERPDIPSIENWQKLVEFYREKLEQNRRTPENLDGMSPATIENKNGCLKHLVDWDAKKLDMITPLFVKAEIDARLKDGRISESRAYDIQKEVKCIFVFAYEAGLLKVNPMAHLKNRRRPKRKKTALNHSEVEKLLSEAHREDHPFFLIWLLTVTLGLRRSELAGLKWSDLDFNTRLGHLCRQKKPKEGIVNKLKSGNDRIVPIPIFVMPFLSLYKLKAQSEFVIEIKNLDWEKGRQAQVLREFCKKIGIREIRHHQLRSTYITLMLNDGVSLGVTMESVGHARIATTNDYYVSSGAELMGATDKLQIKVPPTKNAEILPLVRVAK
ncbi:MAG: site-specific integrase [Bdellovibrionaceae bacterium]|nr:site-specific integrase [Pseudobdellovibrionaceae bacterium]